MIAAIERIAALGDPTRRAIFEILTEEPASVAAIAQRLPVTRPAVSQHLRVLKDAGLVSHRIEGTRHVYKLDPAGLASMRDYFDSFWHKALKSFKAMAEEPPTEKGKVKRRRKR